MVGQGYTFHTFCARLRRDTAEEFRGYGDDGIPATNASMAWPVRRSGSTT